jgi:ADP-ribose pyrophosphatase YjhB (NUDIX family)
MRNSCRAIITKNDKLLLMKRIKKDKLYYVFPGGGIDDNDETLEQCVIREVKEEFSLETYNPILRAFLQCEDGCQFFFTLECDDTNVKIDDESVEKMRQDKDNIYEPVWVEFESVKDLLVPKLIVDKFYEITSSNKILFFKE